MKYKENNLSSSLGTLLNQHFTRKKHIKVTENKVSKKQFNYTKQDPI